MENDIEINTDSDKLLSLISREDVEIQFGEAAASAVVTDQVVTWAKFILTDDKPNENGQRVPLEEFDNIIKTGPYKPVKMALGEIKDGHDDARPLGVITNLTKQGNKVVALAALWDHERTEDVALVRDLVKSNKPVNVSWEILYGNYVIKDGISDLLDTVLKAVTIVGMPAYAGRTQFLAVAAKKWSPAYIEKLPDSSFLHIGLDGTRYFAYRDDTGKIDQKRFPALLEEMAQAPLPENTLKGVRHQVKKLASVVEADAGIQELLMDGEDFITEEHKLDIKELEGKVSELETKLAEANNKLATKEAELATAQETANLANTNVTTLTEELTGLREFKETTEAESQKATKLQSIKDKFGGLGLEKGEEYFTANGEKLLGLEESELDFMLQEMVAFRDAENAGEGKASKKKTPGVPNIPGTIDELNDVTKLAKALRERDSKK